MRSLSGMATIYSQGRQRKEGGDWGWVERIRVAKNWPTWLSAQARERSGVSRYRCYYLMLVKNPPGTLQITGSA